MIVDKKIPLVGRFTTKLLNNIRDNLLTTTGSNHVGWVNVEKYDIIQEIKLFNESISGIVSYATYQFANTETLIVPVIQVSDRGTRELIYAISNDSNRIVPKSVTFANLDKKTLFAIIRARLAEKRDEYQRLHRVHDMIRARQRRY